MRLGRTCPDLDARLFFDPDEIQAAYLLRDKLPPVPLRFNDMLRQIARLGPFHESCQLFQRMCLVF